MLAFCFCAFSQSKPVVVVAPFDANGVDQEDADIITEAFISEYANIGKADVVDRNSFDKIRSQLDFQTSEWSNAEKVAELGKALNATQVIVGQFRKLKSSQILVIIRVEDVNTTKILASLPANTKLNDTLDALDKVGEWSKILSAKVAGEKFELSLTTKESSIEKKIEKSPKKVENSSTKNDDANHKKKQSEPEIRYREVLVDDGWGTEKLSLVTIGGLLELIIGVPLIANYFIADEGDLENPKAVLAAGGIVTGICTAMIVGGLFIPNDYHYKKIPISKTNDNPSENFKFLLAKNSLSISYTLYL